MQRMTADEIPKHGTGSGGPILAATFLLAEVKDSFNAVRTEHRTQLRARLGRAGDRGDRNPILLRRLRAALIERRLPGGRVKRDSNLVNLRH